MSKTTMTVSKQAPISSGVSSGGDRGCEGGFVIRKDGGRQSAGKRTLGIKVVVVQHSAQRGGK